MAIADLIRKLTAGGKLHETTWRVDPHEGVDFLLPAKAQSNPEQCAIESPFFGLQYAYLKGLHEQGYASRNANGYTVLSENVVDLGEEFFQVFQLPPPYPGKYRARFEGNTGQAAFTADIHLILPDTAEVTKYALHGPFLRLSENELYRIGPAEWQALNAVLKHKSLEPKDRGEYENNWLVFQLQLAKKGGMDISLAHFDNLDLLHPQSVGVAIEQLPDGDLSLSPTYGEGIALEDIKSRLGQIQKGDQHCILRIRNKFVLLDKGRLEATEEILSNRRIPKEQIKQFLSAPTAYLDASMIDLDTGFSFRVHGAEKFTHKYFGDVEKSGVDWFAVADGLPEPTDNLRTIVNSEETLQEAEERIRDAVTHGADSVELEGRTFDISDPDQVAKTLDRCRAQIENSSEADDDDRSEGDNESQHATERAVVAIDDNDEQAVLSRSSWLDGFSPDTEAFATENLKRTPYPHQEAGVQWLLAHLETTRSSDGGSGALLADDMGLGKTFMTLVAVQEWYRRCKQRDVTEKPTLIVAPLSLLENWKAEVDATFHKSPFEDIVTLQAGADLAEYRITGAGRETQQEFEESDLIADQEKIRYSLKVGKHFGHQRLDRPRRLVLTTYQTLRDYQFSLSRVDWGIVAFDEAQNIKNPNALATRAAKGLKSEFKLLATGTPVENSLKDFWCLMDTAVPGLLGAWQDFRSAYIAPITSAASDDQRHIKVEVGSRLRTNVGEFMLRRTKSDHLDGLPQKRLYSGDTAGIDSEYLASLAGVMTGAQLSHYDDVIDAVRGANVDDRRQLVLPSLLRLKITSIHQDIEAKLPLPASSKELLKQAEQSVKMSAMLTILRDIEKRDEKVIVFATSKAC